MSHLPLPDGWVQQYDTTYGRHYWVDAKAVPPRAIWRHPYEDDQYLDEHPEIRSKVEKLPVSGPSLTEPPPYDSSTRPTGSGSESSSSKPHDLHATTISDSDLTGDSRHVKKRGVLGKLKDKAIGTKEEREEHKRVKAEQAAQMEERMRQQRMRELEERAAYTRQYGGYGQYHPSGPSPYGMYGPPGGGPSSFGGTSNRRGGMGGMALPLLGGLAGGLLLGEMLDGDGGFGGGDFGGDFGGGDFGGGF